jgi:NTP pyrophosphatase (non-canonical NTP hydrolase)
MLSTIKFQELIQYIDYIDENYSKIAWKDLSKEEKILASILTMNEELWEFSDEISRSLWLTFNKRKIAEYKTEHLEDEAADALISLLCLIKSVWIDNLDGIIQRKIEKNNKRGY